MKKTVPGLSVVSWEEGPIDWSAYDHGLVTMISEVKVGTGAALMSQEISPEDVLEVRLFTEARELHLWREEGRLKGCTVTVGTEAVTLPFEFAVTSAIPDVKSVKGRKIIGVDEDGQAYIACTKLDSIQN